MVWLSLAAGVQAQGPSGTVTVEVTSEGRAVGGAEVSVAGVTRRTDDEGIVTLPAPAGAVDVAVLKAGFAPASTSIQLRPGTDQRVIVELLPQPTVTEEVVVVATRTSRGIDDQPLRVDVLPREEIEEKMMMTPGDVVMMMNEMGGMRVQATSPALGAASVRVQGMRGRYTRFLSDGLPLYGDVGGLGLLQIPPMDLGRVDVIKGVASSLYGAGAMGGVVNLISRRPQRAPVREFLFNQSTRGATDAVGFYGGPLGHGWGLTLLGGGHWQRWTDVNGDAWSDLPHYARAVVRPRLFWENGNGRSFFATTGGTVENRDGGTRADHTALPIGGPYRERLDTRRLDAGMVTEIPWTSARVFTARAAFSRQRHSHRFGDTRERDRHDFGFGELSLRGTTGRHAWAVGTAVERDAYRPRDVPRFAYAFTIPGVFAQDDVQLTRWLSVSGSARVDRHSEYGTFASPRLAALVRSGRWNSRISIGTGFFGPSALTEETEAAGLTRLSVPMPLRAEKGRSASVDVTRTDGPLSYTVTLFASRVLHPIDVQRETVYALANADRAATNTGLEWLGTFRRAPYALTGTYTYVRSREPESGRLVEAALTPRHSAGLVGMWEREGVGRVGFEAYYTGVQRLEADPAAERSRAYVIVGALAERQFGSWRLFVNGENLSDVRQTRWQPLVRSTRGVDGRWTVDAWAPLEGRTVNGGLRIRF